MEAKKGFLLRTIFLTIISLGFFCINSCGDRPDKPAAVSSITVLYDTLINFNQQVVQQESQEIDDFIRRYQWKMKTTQTGLRYMIYQHGAGKPARKGDLVSIHYSLSLLNGALIYKTDSLVPFRFDIGKRKVTRGLEEGVLLMKPGDRAKLVVPSHLGYGLIGDQAMVPERAILVYDVIFVR